MRRVRGLWLGVTKHANHGMDQERPRISMDDLQYAIEEPDYDDGKEIRKAIGPHTIKAYYFVDRDSETLWVRGVSRTTNRWRRPQ